MNDRILVSNLILHGFHGVFEHETRDGQNFHIDIECHLDLSECGQNDDYSKTVCYGQICDLAAKESDAGPYKLIETLAEKIANRILSDFQLVDETHVQIRKPSAPIQAKFDHVAVEIIRKRQRHFALSLGSNMGEKETNLNLALTLLGLDDDINITKTSRFYRTKPWGNEDQDWFMNACAIGTTNLRANQLLRRLKETELKIGRTPGERWGPRLIDIDLLVLDDLHIARPEITLPHPEILSRGFVLKPLAEIAPDLKIEGISVSEAFKRLEDTQGVQEFVVIES